MTRRRFWLENNPSVTNAACESYTVEAPVSGNPREVEKVSETGAGRLRKCVNAELEFKRGFVKAAVSRELSAYERMSAQKASTAYSNRAWADGTEPLGDSNSQIKVTGILVGNF